MRREAYRALSIALLAVLPLLSHSAAAGALVGIVCFSQTANPCSQQQPTFAGTIGSQARLNVIIDGSDSFSQFEVLVKTDPSVLNPISVDTTDSVLVSPEGIPVGGWECINGGGANCGPWDGPGVVHIFGFGRYATAAPTLGILFSINYTITGTANGSPIVFAKGCTGTSVADGTCVTLLNQTPIQVTVQTASFADIPPTGGDFKISAGPNSLTLPRGMLDTSEITFTSLGNFNGTIATSVTSSSPYLTGWLRIAVVTLLANNEMTNLTVFSLTTITPGTYSLNVTASVASISHSATVQVTLLEGQAVNEVQNGDFSGGSYYWTTSIVASRTVSGSCLNCFTTYPIFGVVNNPGPCPTAEKQGTFAMEVQNTLGSSGYVEQSLRIPAGGADLALVSWGRPIEVSIVDKNGSIYYPGPFAASRTGGAGPCAGYTLMHAYDLSRFAGQTVFLRVGADYYGYDIGDSFFSAVQAVPIGNAAIRDFNISVNPSSITVPRTQDGTVNVTVNSLNGFATTVSLNATIIPPLPYYTTPGVPPSLAFTQNMVSLQPGYSTTVTLTVFAPKDTPALVYDLKITADSTRSRTYLDVALTIPGVALLLSIQNPATAHPGDSITIVNRFVNVGVLPVRIISAQISTSFGSFTVLSTNPCQGSQSIQVCCYNLCDIPGAPIISPGDNLTIDVKINVPLSAQLGNHTLVENVQWQYQTNFPKLWYDAGPNVEQSRILLVKSASPAPSPNAVPSPSQLASYLGILAGLLKLAVPIALGMGGLITIVTVLLLRRRPAKLA